MKLQTLEPDGAPDPEDLVMASVLVRCRQQGTERRMRRHQIRAKQFPCEKHGVGKPARAAVAEELNDGVVGHDIWRKCLARMLGPAHA